jgi:hypothetical protein
MKVLDLQCSHHHVFEGWFASEDDFQSQLARGLVACPLCADTAVSKKLSAPRLNLGVGRHEAPSTEVAQATSEHVPNEARAAAPAVVDAPAAELQAALLKMVRHVVANTEDVGKQFAEEARKMHYGDAEHRNIRGQASAEETKELLDEGIAVMPLPLPDAVKETLQ